MGYSIRKADENDIDKILEIRQELSCLENKLEPYYYNGESISRDRILSKMMDDEREYYFAMEEKQVVGMMIIEEDKTFKVAGIVPHKFLYISDIIAVKKRAGVGTFLLDYAKSIVEERKLDYYELDVSSRNLAAREFYKKNGLRETAISMRSK